MQQIRELCPRLDAAAYQRLKQIVADTDNLIDRLKTSNPAIQLRWPY